MTGREQYPDAPADRRQRRAWMNARNARIQGGPPPNLAFPRRPLAAFPKGQKKK